MITLKDVNESQVKHLEKKIAQLTKLIPHTTDNGAAIKLVIAQLTETLVTVKGRV